MIGSMSIYYFWGAEDASPGCHVDSCLVPGGSHGRAMLFLLETPFVLSSSFLPLTSIGWIPKPPTEGGGKVYPLEFQTLAELLEAVLRGRMVLFLWKWSALARRSAASSCLFLSYRYRPRKVRAIPKACMGVVAFPNQTMATTTTKTRLINEATEYDTGEIMESRTNAMMFCAKWKTPLKINSSINGP